MSGATENEGSSGHGGTPPPLEKDPAVVYPSHVSCVVCSSTATHPSRSFRDTEWKVWDCQNCQCSFVSPALTAIELSRVYERQYHSIANRDPRFRTEGVGTEKYRRNLCVMLGFLEQVERLRGGPGILLDIGCSYGPMLEAGLERGWTPVGIELDAEVANSTSRRLGVPVEVGSGVNCMRNLAQYDLIVMSHWLEHIDNPQEALSVAREHLRDDGMILIRVPNGHSKLARATGVCWLWYGPAGHIVYYSPPAIERLAQRQGMSVLALYTHRGGSLPFPLEIVLSWIRGVARMARSVSNPIRRGTLQPGGPSGPPSLLRLAIEIFQSRFEPASAYSRWKVNDSEIVCIIRKPNR